MYRSPRPLRPSSLRRRRTAWRLGALAVASIVLGSLLLPHGRAVAEPEPDSAAEFASSLEAQDPQPDWSSATVKSSGVVRSTTDDTPGFRTAVGNGPTEADTAKTEVGFSGLKALHYAGHQQTADRSYAYNKLFAVDIPVTAATTLSYKIFPELMNPHLGKGLPTPSSYVSVDLEFSDGTHLRDLRVEDQHGYRLTADQQGASKTLYANQWNAVTAVIGERAAGKTISRILLDYDNPDTGAGDFSGWLDDIVIAHTAPRPDRDSLVDWVDTTRGTNSNGDFSRGNTIPATAVPHGFNFWTPVTDAGTTRWLYRYQEDNNAANQPQIQAFSLSHEPYPWGGERNTIQVMPAEGADEPDPDRTARAMAFSHDHEVAKPYYYGVTLDNGLRAEIAPTDHAAMMRFRFTGDTSNLIFDNITNDGGITLDPESGTLTGYTDVGVESRARMFVYATFDRPVRKGAKLDPSGRSDVAGYYQFDTSADSDKTVTMRIATSLISIDQAKRNLQQEITDDDTFETVRDRAKKLWNDKLAVITDVRGATPDQLTTLYSSLYRLNLYPNSSYENTGTVADPDLRHASDYAAPVSDSTPTRTGAKIISGISYRPSNFWDTYRTSWPADALFYPEQTGRLIEGSLSQFRESDWIATGMVGSSSDVSFADAYLKGVTGFDIKTAYRAAVKNATVAPTEKGGREGLERAIFLGYTPTTTPESVSRTTENAINDFGIAQLSEALYRLSAPNDPERETYQTNARYFLDRAREYAHLFDPKINFFQGRDDDGDWRQAPEDYNPDEWGCQYTEANGWGMAFATPQDGRGLANLYGGRKALADRLDEYFSTTSTAEYPGCYGNVIHEMREAAYMQMGQFALNNQPDHHMPYMYNFTDKPYRTQKVVREALARQFVGSEIGQGYPGDEDTGEMSAWYVFSALGFYPLQVGLPEYAIGSPLFTSATINLENGHKIVVNAPKNSAKNIYVQGLKINGESYRRTTLPHDLLAKGAVLDFDLGPQPSRWGAGRDDAPDSITDGDEPPQPLQDLTGSKHGTASSTDGAVDELFDNTSETQSRLDSDEPAVTWRFAGGSEQTAQLYTVTSGARTEDPTGWILQGSTDGTTWTTIDHRSKQSFDWRRQTRVFAIKHPAAFSRYRIKFSGPSKQPIALSEIQLLGRPPSQPGKALDAELTAEQPLALPQDEPTTSEAQLTVDATAPGTAEITIGDIEAPQGWTVEPRQKTLELESDGKPVQGTVPFTVTIPGGTPEGEYPVAATVTMPGAAPVRSVALYRVTEKIAFDTGTADEQPWLSDADGSQVDGGGNRFADNANHFTYTFALPQQSTGATVTLLIDNQFRVQASADGKDWTDVLVEEREIRDGSNRAERSVDLAPYLGSDNTVSVKVSDSFPDDGWGGRVGHVTVTMSR
ncbi:GH92 family glycosyl hydrolase [Microlunatus soli]|uniref:Alpha-1,2-mannosidase, putative n=1 Tax=Microlunatus soli TaxID=630515 RepID=A0A1H1TC96_9ACTN|nr:GH92 family glycosyl hydrolase [Microlunatus soli]SDS57887.1 alpha-1,2-mannosidase, putative [Microlunatus soli]